MCVLLNDFSESKNMRSIRALAPCYCCISLRLNLVAEIRAIFVSIFFPLALANGHPHVSMENKLEEKHKKGKRKNVPQYRKDT